MNFELSGDEFFMMSISKMAAEPTRAKLGHFNFRAENALDFFYI